MKKLVLFSSLAATLACCGTVTSAAEISGTILYPGSQTGAVRITASQSFTGNKVLKLSGAGTVRIDSLTSLAGPELTIQFWFKGATVQSAVRQQASGYIIAGWNGGHLSSTDGALAGAVTGVTDGNWHHVIMTRKRNGTFAGYVDGTLKASAPVGATDLPNVNGAVYLGSLANLGEYTIGELDEVAIWNRALPASEIAANWSSAISPTAAGLVGYWKFDDETYNDSTTNGFAGSPIGDAAIVSDDIPIYSQTVTVAGPGPYTITGMPGGSGYSVTAFMDVNGDSVRQFGEPSGSHPGNPLTLSGSLSGVDITLTEPPHITRQPQAPAGNRAGLGGSIGFSVTAQGTPNLSYQWYRDASPLVNNARISGATTANLQINGLVAGDAGGYSCTIANAQGSVASKAPQLYVVTDPKTISGNFIYGGTGTGQVHTLISQLRNNNKVLNLSNTATNYAATTLMDLSGDELSIEYWFSGSGNFSVVRQQGGPGYIVAGWGAGLDILSHDGGTSGVKVSNPPSMVMDGNWHHVAMTWKRNTVNGFASYLDGELVEQRNSADAAVPNIGAQVFLGTFAGVAEFAHGMLDEVAIWGKALSRSDIRSHARDGLSGSEAGLKGYWNFDDGIGQDLTPNGNHAELRGGATIDVASIPGQGAVYPDVFPGVGHYAITGIPAGANYSLFAFLDNNGNGTQDISEPHGAYSGNPLNLASSLSGADIVLFEPVTILTNPVSVTVLEGETIHLSAVTGGTSNTFQWRHYSTALATGGRVSGAQSESLTITGAQLSDAGAYSLVVVNPVGTVTSMGAAVIVQPAALTSHLIGNWRFDETTGTVAQDSTGLSQAGNLYNFPGDDSQWVPGVAGRALSFDPTNQNHVIAPDYLKPTNTMAVSAWVWAASRPAWASVVKNWGPGLAGQFHLGLYGESGEISNFITDGAGNAVSAVDTTPLPLGSWQHVAFVADGVHMVLYRNGIQVASSAAYNGTLLVPPMASLGIGVKTDDTGTSPNSAAPAYWQGKIDDIGIWSRALSSDEIQGLYLSGLNGKGISQASAVKRITLGISLSGSQVTLHYTAGTLEWSNDPGTGWTPVPGASAPAFTTPATLKKFFRVR